MRIFLGVKEIAGYYTNLEKGFKELGIEADYWELTAHPFQYRSGSREQRFSRVLRFVNAKRSATPWRRPLSKVWWSGLDQGLRVVLLLWAIVRYDAFVFGAKSSFLPDFLDLPLLRFFRKRIIYTFHGSDVRPPYINGTDLLADHGRTVEDCVRLAARKKRDLRTIERYADVLISHPPYAHFHERPFVTWLSIGNPVSPAATPRAEPSSRVRILHSPSNPTAKGTDAIRNAVGNLLGRGFDLDYVEIKGQPNRVVISELALCDVVVDQLYTDIPMASFATEASILGKPVVVGGYITIADLGASSERVPPCELCHPDELESRLEALVTDASLRVAAGERARRFVLETWAPAKVASRLLRVIEGDIPVEWWFDPSEIRYLHGCCISELKARHAVRDVIALYGVAALQLGDKPQLERRFMEWANEAGAECFANS